MSLDLRLSHSEAGVLCLWREEHVTLCIRTASYCHAFKHKQQNIDLGPSTPNSSSFLPFIHNVRQGRFFLKAQSIGFPQRIKLFHLVSSSTQISGSYSRPTPRGEKKGETGADSRADVEFKRKKGLRPLEGTVEKQQEIRPGRATAAIGKFPSPRPASRQGQRRRENKGGEGTTIGPLV